MIKYSYIHRQELYFPETEFKKGDVIATEDQVAKLKSENASVYTRYIVGVDEIPKGMYTKLMTIVL